MLLNRRAHGIKVYRCPLWVPTIQTGLRRMLHLLSFMISSLPMIFRQVFWKPQVIFTVEPALVCAPVALLAATAAGSASWLHIQDFEVDAAFELGLLPAKGLIHSVALSLEKAIYRAFDRVSTISTKMADRAQSKGVPDNRVVLFPNWVDIGEIAPAPGPNSFRTRLGLESKIVVLYSGNMGSKQGLEILPALVRNFDSDTRLHFLFCGDGAFRPQLEMLLNGLPNVTLLPLQPAELLNQLLNAADIHLLPQRAGAADLVMPSKLTGMLASGKPVIATVPEGTQVAQVVERCGVVVAPGDEDALYSAIRRLADDPSLCNKLGAYGRSYAVNQLGKEEVLRRFERALNLLVTGFEGRAD